MKISIKLFIALFLFMRTCLTATAAHARGFYAHRVTKVRIAVELLFYDTACKKLNKFTLQFLYREINMALCIRQMGSLRATFLLPAQNTAREKVPSMERAAKAKEGRETLSY